MDGGEEKGAGGGAATFGLKHVHWSDLGVGEEVHEEDMDGVCSLQIRKKNESNDAGSRGHIANRGDGRRSVWDPSRDQNRFPKIGQCYASVV